MFNLSETLALLGASYNEITQQTNEPSACNLADAYQGFQENPLDVTTHARLILAFEAWYACQPDATRPVAGATPGPWQLGEREPGEQYDIVKLWGGCLNAPGERHFIIAWLPLHRASCNCSTLHEWSARNAAIISASLELYQAAKALLNAECGYWDDVHEAVRLASIAMRKIDCTHI